MSDKISSRGLRREYRVLYRLLDGHALSGPVLHVDVVALTEGGVRAQIALDQSIVVISVTEVRVLLDHNQATFDLEEAAEYLRGSIRKVQHWVAAGVLPQCKGHALFTRRQLDSVIEGNVTKG